MSKPKWTPGPWRLGHRGKLQQTIEGGDGSYACAVHLPHPIGGVLAELDLVERNANARLIAAAPEMAELLGDLCTLIERDVQKTGATSWLILTEQARALLAKINGDVT